MSDPVEIALISAIATVSAGIIAGGIAYLVKRLDRLDVSVNGRLTELLNLTRESSHAKGMKDEKENNRGSSV